MFKMVNQDKGVKQPRVLLWIVFVIMLIAVGTGVYFAWGHQLLSGVDRSELADQVKQEQWARLSQQIDNIDGTVTDLGTGLQWMKCSLGQVWEAGTCLGEAKKFNWHQAMRIKQEYAGKSDWQLPTHSHLLSIRFCSEGLSYMGCSESSTKPTINQSVFPNTYQGGYWSSTELDSSPEGAWLMVFLNGYDMWINKEDKLAVRLVRPAR